MNYPILVWWLALAVCVPSVVLSKATSPETNMENYGITWIFEPDENGNPHVVYLDEDTSNEPLVIQVELYNRNNRFRDKGVRTKFVLFNETYFHKPEKTLTLLEDFDAQLDTKMLTHGFQSNANESVVKLIRKAYEQHGDFNIFGIDWITKANQTLGNFQIAVDFVVEVGQAVAELIKMLDHRSADSKRIHLIGHSLGAHVMGNAGYNFTSDTKKTIGRITGLDPAGPGFEDRPFPTYILGRHLNSTDADFVDVIHTDTRSIKSFGFRGPIGHVDFYPNGNTSSQLGCEWSNPFGSHSRAYQYYAESINSTVGFYAKRCSNLEAAGKGKCSGEEILMGDRVPVGARGIYFLTTNNESPFAKGH